jgi:hypothetical protein
MAVTISANQHCYPEFKEGQVLTHNDLNALRDYLYTKLSFHGRALIGFGVACGLDGTIAGSSLSLTTGFALAQGGRELIVDVAPNPVNLATVALDNTSYAFIDTSKGGVTPILRATETVQQASGECTAAGCTTHTDLHCEGAEIVYVAGQLKLGPDLGNSVFDLQPIIPKTNPSLTGFAGLRDNLYRALNGLVDNETRNLLSALRADGPKGIDLLKVGIVNEVLYTLWDYYRCRANESAPCGGYTGNAAVALGWASQSGGNWAWTCRYRHDFQLALPLFRGVHATGCEDVCGRYLDRIRELIQDFTPPAVPPAGGGGRPPNGTRICTIADIKAGRCPDWWGHRRPDWPPIKWIDPSRGRPKPVNPGDPAPWEEVFTADPWETFAHANAVDPVAAGVINSFTLIGTDGPAMRGALENTIKDSGLDAAVTTLSISEFNQDERDGQLEHVLVAAASDTITLGLNDDGVVVALGIVPTGQTLGGVSAIRETAIGARDAVANAVEELGGLQERVETFSTHTNEIQDSLSALQERVDGFKTRLDTQEVTVTRLDDSNTRLTTRLDLISQRGTVGLGTGTVTTPGTINASIYEALDSMGRAIKAGSTRRAGPAVRQELANAAPQLSILQRETVGSTHVAAAQPVALVDVVDSMVLAIGKMGLADDAPEMKDLQANVSALKGQLGFG